MTDHQIDDPLKELEAALAIEPSPAFAAGVRARVAESRRAAWLTWQELAPAAVVVVAVLGGFLWRAGQVRVQPAAVGTPNAPAAMAARIAPDVPVARIASPDKPVSADRAAVRVTTPAAPEVLVPPDQAMALNRFLAGLRARATAERQSADLSPVVLEELPRINPVRIELITIDPLVPSPPSPGGKERDR